MLSEHPAINEAKVMTVMGMQMVGLLWLPLFSVAELLMSPVMKEDSCFLTVSFHIRRIRLCQKERRRNREEDEVRWHVHGGEATTSRGEEGGGIDNRRKEMWVKGYIELVHERQ